MAHFAKISENNQVLQVLTLENKYILNSNGLEDESIGQQYLQTHNNWASHLWIQTSYNTHGNQHKNGGTAFRGNYAGIGYTWDEDNQMFFPKKPYTSWVKHIASASWKSPLGDAPTLTNAQISENTAGTHFWSYTWNEDLYQADNTNGWVIVDSLIA